MERPKVVAQYANGKAIKGYTLDFFPNKERFHITPTDKPSDKPIEVMFDQLLRIACRHHSRPPFRTSTS